jgi:uncharacterized Rossmann fold enzyme
MSLTKKPYTFEFREQLSELSPVVVKGAKIYVFGCVSNYDQICKRYKYYVNVDINDYIDGFIDNDELKQHGKFYGKYVYAPHEIDPSDSIVLIAVGGQAAVDIFEQLAELGFIRCHNVFSSQWYIHLIMRYEYKRFEYLFKNKHKGERCFIVGNAPSLTASDLDLLKNEITFASNQCYLMFDKSDWRPTYYAVADPLLLKRLYSEIKQNIKSPIFYACNSVLEMPEFDLEEAYYYWLNYDIDWNPNITAQPNFSENPALSYWGASVTYDILQLAVYMGFKEIYFLGIDFSYAVAVNKRGELQFDSNQALDHFTDKYIKSTFLAETDTIIAAYKKGKNVCEEKGITIRNATRGGKLNVFERVDFDELFCKHEMIETK